MNQPSSVHIMTETPPVAKNRVIEQNGENGAHKQCPQRGKDTHLHVIFSIHATGSTQ
jgi:hypothetical protein